MKTKISKRKRNNRKITSKNIYHGGDQDGFKLNSIYIYKNMICRANSEGLESSLEPICSVDLQQEATDAHDDLFESYGPIKYNDSMSASSKYNKEEFEQIKFYNKNRRREKKKRGPIVNKLTPDERRMYKNMLFSNDHKIEIPISEQELMNQEKLTNEKKQTDVYLLINQKLDDSQYMYDLCSKLNISYDFNVYEWFIKNIVAVMNDFFKNYPMIVNRKSESELMKDIIKLGIQKYEQEQSQIQKRKDIENVSLNKQFLINFKNIFFYQLISHEHILKRCTQLGQIDTQILQQLKTNHDFMYIRLGVHHEQQNILYHCLLEAISEVYYLQIDINNLNKVVSMLKQKIVFNYLNGEDFEIYFQPKNLHSKNYVRDPKVSFESLQNYIENISDNDDHDIPLLSSVLNYNIIVVTQEKVPLNYSRFCFKNNRNNLVILKTIKDGQVYYEPIIQILGPSRNLGNLTYKQFRKSDLCISVFNSNHDIIMTLISKYILLYSENTEEFSACFQNFEISDLYFEQLFTSRYLPEHFRYRYLQNKLCATSTLFTPGDFSIPKPEGRTYNCSSKHPLLFRIDSGMGGYEDLCCTDNLRADGVGEFITRYNNYSKTFDPVKVPLNRFTTFINEYEINNKRIMRTIIESTVGISKYDLKLILPIFNNDIFNNRFQIRKFINSNKDFMNNIDIITRMATSEILIPLANDTHSRNLKEYFNLFEESWIKFKEENIDFVNSSTRSVDNLIKIYQRIFKDKKRQEKEQQEKEDKENKKRELLDSMNVPSQIKVEPIIDPSNNNIPINIERLGQFDLIKDSIPENKLTFYSKSAGKELIFMFLGGPDLKNGNYLVVQASSKTKISLSPSAHQIYSEIVSKFKKNKEQHEVSQSVYNFLDDSLKKIQDMPPEKIEDLLKLELYKLPN